MTKQKSTESGVLHNFIISVIIAPILLLIIFGFTFLQGEISRSKEEKRREHLDDILAACINSEKSNLCSKLKKKYNISFKYCKSILDPINEQYIPTTLPDGSFTIIENPIWHGVAWEGDSSMPPKDNLFNYGIYQDCVDSIDTKAVK